MRITSASLADQLKQDFQPLYLLFGAETLLVEEAVDQIRSTAKASGYHERLRLTVEAGFDWNQLREQGQAMSLFSEKRLIELRIPTGKPGDAGAKALISFAESMHSDTTLAVICGSIEKRSQNTKWFKTLEKSGVVIDCPTIKTDRLPDWIARRLNVRGLECEPEAVVYLCQFVEGNLLAAAQEIDLLALLYPNKKITVETIAHTIADHARFSVYSFADACLVGSTNRITRILQSLKRDQTEPIIILWALTRDVRILCQLSAAMAHGERPQTLFKRFGIWSNRSAIVNTALKRLSYVQWENLLRRLGRADLMVKGSAPMQRTDIWEEIESISLRICGVNIP